MPSRVAILNAWDCTGGAARAAHRLHTGLRAAGAESTMVVQTKSGDDWSVVGPASKWQRKLASLRGPLERLALWRHRAGGTPLFSAAWLPDGIPARVAEITPEIIHLHWINAGFVRIESLRRLESPLIWTLHDMWPFTGGCHYTDNCHKFEKSCGACPALASEHRGDLSHRVWLRKRAAWKDLDLTIVTPSRWLADEARKSSLFQDRRIEVIPNGRDLDRFQPVERHVAREILGLPQSAHLILFGAMDSTSDRRKGFHFLEPALGSLAEQTLSRPTELVVFGASEPENPSLPGLRTHYLGTLGDDVSLKLAYAAADVFVAPSLQDNLPNTVAESLACGTPVVAFDVGGLPEMIDHEKNGYLARAFEPTDLAHGIAWSIADESRSRDLRQTARAKALQDYDLLTCAQRHLDLYEDVLSRAKTPSETTRAVSTP